MFNETFRIGTKAKCTVLLSYCIYQLLWAHRPITCVCAVNVLQRSDMLSILNAAYLYPDGAAIYRSLL